MTRKLVIILRASSCLGLTFLPAAIHSGPGSCVSPLPLELPASLELDPCDYKDTTGTRSRDVMMLLGPEERSRDIVIRGTGVGVQFGINTECPVEDIGSFADGVVSELDYGLIHMHAYSQYTHSSSCNLQPWIVAPHADC